MLYAKDLRLIIPEERNTLHSLDCELLTKVYIDLLDKKEPTFDLSIKDTNTSNNDQIDLKNRKGIIVEICEEEVKEHKNFLKRIFQSLLSLISFLLVI